MASRAFGALTQISPYPAPDSPLMFAGKIGDTTLFSTNNFLTKIVNCITKIVTKYFFRPGMFAARRSRVIGHDHRSAVHRRSRESDFKQIQ